MSANDLMVLLTIGAAGLSLLAIAYAATLWAFRKDHPENARQAREWLTAAAVIALLSGGLLAGGILTGSIDLDAPPFLQQGNASRPASGVDCDGILRAQLMTNRDAVDPETINRMTYMARRNRTACSSGIWDPRLSTRPAGRLRAGPPPGQRRLRGPELLRDRCGPRRQPGRAQHPQAPERGRTDCARGPAQPGGRGTPGAKPVGPGPGQQHHRLLGLPGRNSPAQGRSTVLAIQFQHQELARKLLKAARTLNRQSRPCGPIGNHQDVRVRKQKRKVRQE